MGAFQTGFQVGTNIAREALARKEREEQIKREEEDRKQARELRDLQMQDIRERRDRESRSADLNQQAVGELMPGLLPVGAQPTQPAPAMTQAPAGPTPVALALNGIGTPASAMPAPAQEAPAAPAARTIEAAGVAPAAAPAAAPAQAPAAAPAPSYSPQARALALRIRAAAQAGRDTGAMMGELRAQLDSDFEQQQFAAYTGAPEQVGAALGNINRTSPRITASQPDRRGFVRLAVLDPDKDNSEATFLKLSKAEQTKLWVGAQMMQRNPKRGLELIGEVNRTLAAAVAADNNLTTTLASNTNDVVEKGMRSDVSRSQIAAAELQSRVSDSQLSEAETRKRETQTLREASVALRSAEQSGNVDAVRKAELAVLRAGGVLPKRDDTVANDIRGAFQAAIKPDQFGRSPTPEAINATMSAGYGPNWRDLMMGRSAPAAAAGVTPAAGNTGAARPGGGVPLNTITMADIQATADRNRQPIGTVMENVARSYGMTAEQLAAQLRQPVPAAPRSAPAPARRPAEPPTAAEVAPYFAP